jgi:hypothetical protein
LKKAINFARDFAPKLTDSDVLTIEICGEFFKLREATEIYKYFKNTTYIFPGFAGPDKLCPSINQFVASQTSRSDHSDRKV